jgi:hypothetical protein
MQVPQLSIHAVPPQSPLQSCKQAVSPVLPPTQVPQLSRVALPRGDSLYQIALLRDPQSVYWNGALSDRQLAWLKAELDASITADERVLVFSHFPLGGTPGLNLWNAEEVLDILNRYENVLGFFGGHLHQSYTVSYNGPPQIGVPSLLGDTNHNEYGIASVYPTYIEWKGQKERLLAFKDPPIMVPILLWSTGLTWLVFFAFAYCRRFPSESDKRPDQRDLEPNND